MGFDLSTAKPVQRFDLSSAQPVHAEETPEEQPAPRGPAGPQGTALDPIYNAVTLGLGDELYGAVGGAYAALTTEEGWLDAYKRLSGNMRAGKDAYQENNPLLSPALELGAGAAAGGMSIAKMAPGIAQKGLALLGPKLGKQNAERVVAAVMGSLEAGVYGAADADPGDRVEGALKAAPFGAVGGVAANEVGQLIGRRAANKKNVGALLARGADDAETAGKALKPGTNKVVSDPIAKRTQFQGWDDGVVAMAKTATPEDKKTMLKMLDIYEQGKKNTRFAANNRPSDALGTSVNARVRHVIGVKKEAAAQLDAVAQSLKAKRANFAPAGSGFLDNLKSQGIGLDDAGKLDFSNSTIDGQRGNQAILSRIYDRYKKVLDSGNAYDAHQLKKFIDNQVSYGKQKTGLTNELNSILKGLRHGVDDVLDTSFPSYNKVNSQFAETKQALDAYQSAIGPSIDLESDSATTALGTVTRRLLGNSQKRGQQLDALAELDSVSKRYGKAFNDDLITQASFADALEGMFGPSAPSSFYGDIDKAVRRGSSSEGLSAFLMDKAADTGAAVVGRNEENAIKAMRDLLAR